MNRSLPVLLIVPMLASYTASGTHPQPADAPKQAAQAEAPEYFLLRTEVEKAYGYTHATFDDVIVENVYTTNMAAFLKAAPYRTSLYKKQFPTGTWLEVKGLALPEFLIEIELEARVPNR